MTKSIQCSACGKKLRADSQFCWHCGAKLSAATPESIPDEATLIQQSASIKTDPEQAVNACRAYFQHYPDGDAVMDIDLTNSIILTFFSMHQIANNQFPQIQSQQDYTFNAKRCNNYYPHEFSVLKNGIVIDLRTNDKEKHNNALLTLTSWQKLCDLWLDKVYAEAESEKDVLLVDGKTRALVEQKTMEEIYRDAEIYYKCYTDGKYDNATRGLEHLKELNPMDAYFRNILGACYSQRGKTLDAVREYIYGYHLDPGSADIASSLIRELTALHLHGAAYVRYCHFQQYGQKGSDDAIRTVEVLGKTAKLCTQGLVSILVDITEQDYVPKAKDIMDEFSYTEKPWLIAPPESRSREHIVLDNKKIFISYRRADSEEMANNIQAKLKVDYPSSKVFLDKSSMVAGEAFTEQIHNEIDNADIFLILISPRWSSIQGKARIKETADILRRELLRAVRKEKPIVPVLINNAKMPTKQSLPKVLQFLTQLHAITVRDASFNADIGLLESNLTSVLTEVAIRQKRFEQHMDELDKLAKENPDAYEKELQDMFENGKEHFATYVRAKSEHGEGIPEGKMNIYGVWESVAVAPNGTKSTIDIDIEDQAGSVYTGTLKTVDPYGNVTADLELSGNWSRVLDIDKKLFLGFSLTYVKPDNTPGTLFIPFHRKIGHNYVGDDSQGLHFSSTNIEPRDSGF